MFEEMFNPLYAPLPDYKLYLERIGVTDAKPDKATLDRLVFAHQTTVPFENLDPYDAGRETSVGIPALFDKVVTRRRGGYCFELNAAFMALLQAVGFDCYAIGVRVVWGNNINMPITHRATIVTIDGKRYFCDVGFGGPSPRGGVLVDSDEGQQVGPDIFRMVREENGIVIGRDTDGGFERLLKFDDQPVDPVDFYALNYYQSTSAQSVFTMGRMINLAKEDGSISLTGNVLKIRSGDKLEEKALNAEDEIRAALKEHFGIVVDFPLKT